ATVALRSLLEGAAESPTATATATQAELLSDLAAGAVTAALAVPFASMPGVRIAPTVRIGPADDSDDGTYRLSGTVQGVADVLPADVLIVPADGVPHALFAVRADAAGLMKIPAVSLGMTRPLADVRLDNAPAIRLAAGPPAGRAVATGLRAGGGRARRAARVGWRP